MALCVLALFKYRDLMRDFCAVLHGITAKDTIFNRKLFSFARAKLFLSISLGAQKPINIVDKTRGAAEKSS